ncbi:hypothetical protein MOBT1_001801 [Malassezia obtusa]|uniref:Uncharacterized protein n=1 Tax=Malassezia obtusa TaxID=76774 RepID=A0AAF0E0V1_9BASI|nr:hypothetical protein MOBT1_001801 [Malassezia obtusa]
MPGLLTAASTSTVRDDSKDKSKLANDTPAAGAAPTETGGAGERTEELELSDDPDFPSGFSVSSESDNSENGGLSDADGAAANDDTMEDVEFDLDEVDDDSDNDDAEEVDIDAELDDSDDNDNNDDE